jgi:hypothetical protein
MGQRAEKEANGGRFKLRDLLSVPMQRILKYHLLLQKLLDETSKVIFFISYKYYVLNKFNL